MTPIALWGCVHAFQQRGHSNGRFFCSARYSSACWLYLSINELCLGSAGTFSPLAAAAALLQVVVQGREEGVLGKREQERLGAIGAFDPAAAHLVLGFDGDLPCPAGSLSSESCRAGNCCASTKLRRAVNAATAGSYVEVDLSIE